MVVLGRVVRADARALLPHVLQPTLEPVRGGVVQPHEVDAVVDAEPDEPQVSDELEEARWFTADEVRQARARGEWGGNADDGQGPVLSPSISISRWLIEHWLSTAV